MSSIKAKCSAIDAYADNCRNNYAALLNIAMEILSQVEKYHAEVQKDYDRINEQIVRLKMMRDDVEDKVKSYGHSMEKAADDAERYKDEISYLYSHPDTVTSTNDDGEETTEEVYDYAAIRAASRKKEEAEQTCYCFREKYGDARQASAETKAELTRFEMIKNGIGAVGESIQNDIYEIKKQIGNINSEAEHNVRSLQGVIDSLSSYLASKAMFMPLGAHYDEFATSSSSFSGGGGSSSGANIKRSSKKAEDFSRDFIDASKNEKSYFSIKSIIKAFDIGGKIDHNKFNNLVASKPIVKQAARNWSDQLDSSTEFCGVNGGHYADELNLLLKEQGVNDFNKVEVNRRGDYAYSFGGTCGLASFANVLRLLGNKNATENDIVTFAYNNNLCSKPSFDKNGRLIDDGGGTTNANVLELAKMKGLDAARSPDVTMAEIDAVLQRGGAMMMSVVSEDLACDKVSRGFERTDHWVCVMGVKKSKYSGKIEGVYIRDTGRHSGHETAFIDVEKFNKMRSYSGDFAGICFFNKENG